MRNTFGYLNKLKHGTAEYVQIHLEDCCKEPFNLIRSCCQNEIN